MHLFDLPAVNNRVITKKRSILTAPNTSLLKGQQEDIYGRLKNLLTQDDPTLSLLTAPAGCGKSYLISMLLEDYMYLTRTSRIACTATTNKAVKVAYRMADYYHPNIEYSTLHKLLGLKEQINSDGTTEFVQDRMNVPSLERYDILIVDEVSMLDDVLFLGNRDIKGLMQYQKEGLKIIFVGDECQIPPVNRKDCVLFHPQQRKKYGINYYHMNTIIRQAEDNPIIQYATEIRSNLNRRGGFMKRENMLYEEDKGVYFLNRMNDGHMQYLTDLFYHLFSSPNFHADPDFAKVAAYRNSTIRGINKVIRKLIYNTEDLQRIEVGEKIIAQTPIFEDNIITIHNNEEMEVVEHWEKTDVVNGGQFRIPFHLTKVKYNDIEGSEVMKHIKILTYEGMKIHKNICKQLLERAKNTKKGTFQGSNVWSDYYQFLRLYADINYNYAMTSHKCQGSTYENVVVLESDIMKNFRVEEKNRIFYTACTRPRQRLFVL